MSIVSLIRVVSTVPARVDGSLGVPAPERNRYPVAPLRFFCLLKFIVLTRSLRRSAFLSVGLLVETLILLFLISTAALSRPTPSFSLAV